ncbi:MAG: pilin [Burkholderiales bacterium]|jgi:hypothetical protein|nr:pilin [Burkholderiales bacterium]
MNKKTQQTILIAVASLAILGYFLKISYASFVTKTKISEAFLLIEPIQNNINEYAQKNNGFPVNIELNNSAFGLPQPFEIQSTYISSVVVHKELNNEQVTLFAYINPVIIPNLENGKGEVLESPYISFRGSYLGRNINWECGSNLAKHYLPASCSGS